MGTGTSQGVPVIACECAVCASDDVRDIRLRASVMVTVGDKNFVIDTGPDFRQQMLVGRVQDVAAILLTHQHKDHIAGLDDVRAFNFKYEKDMPVYATVAVEKALRREFSYIFEPSPYPGIPRVTVHTIYRDRPFEVDGVHFEPIEVMHHLMPVMGFKVGGFVYITDAKTIADDQLKKIQGVDILVINALRMQPHIAHLNLEEALDMVQRIQPKQAYFTHISHWLGTYTQITPQLPPNVHLAYDGLEITLP